MTRTKSPCSAVRLLRGLLILIAASQFARSGIAASPASTWDDPRLSAWAAAANGDAAALLDAVESDVVSLHPHPFAPHVWTIAHARRGDLDQALDHIAGTPLANALKSLPEVVSLFSNNRYEELLERFPAANVSDPWVAHYLFSAAMRLHRHRDA